MEVGFALALLNHELCLLFGTGRDQIGMRGNSRCKSDRCFELTTVEVRMRAWLRKGLENWVATWLKETRGEAAAEARPTTVDKFGNSPDSCIVSKNYDPND